MATRKLEKGEEQDWAWELIGMTPDERRKTVVEKVEKWYSTSDASKIKRAFIKLAKSS